MADLRRLIDGYDCGIRYMDEHIGQLLAALEEAGVMDDLAIIISSDHGENLGELGIYGEHGTADHITCRIPLIIRWPGGAQGGVDDGLHYNLDLGPTLAELLGRPAAALGRRELRSAITRRADCGREHLVLSQCATSASAACAGATGSTCAPTTTAITFSRTRCSSTWPTIRTSSTTWRPPVPTSARKGCAI